MSEEIDKEAPIRDRLRRRNVDVLAHQLEVERQERRSVTSSDLLATAIFFGLTAGSMSLALSATRSHKGQKKTKPRRKP